MKEKVGENSMEQISGGASYQINSKHGGGYSLTRAEEDYLIKNDFKIIHDPKTGRITNIETLDKDVQGVNYRDANPKEVIELLKNGMQNGAISKNW